MIITILSEPRTGSSNLLYWFGTHEDYSISFEPSDTITYKDSDESIKYFKKGNKDRTDYKTFSQSFHEYKTRNLVIKEIIQNTPFQINLVEKTDKVIVLFRENFQEQLQSLVSAYNTRNWFNKYVYDDNNILTNEESILKKYKEEIEEYKTKYFSISYEDLYYRGKINKLKDYIGDLNLNTISFPYGGKYRLEKKSII